MRIEQLRSFVAIYETASFTQAATQLYTSQPVVTRHLAHLEQELGGPLFTRTTRTVSPTQAGTLLYEPAREALRLIDEGVSTCRALNRRDARLTVGYEYFYMDHHTTPWLDDFRSACSGTIAIDVIEQPSAQLFSALSEGKIDGVFVGLTREELIPAYLERRRIVSMDEVIYVGKEHPLAHRDHVTVDDLLEESFIYPLSKPTSRESLVALDFEDRGKPLHATVTVHQPSALRVVENGNSIIDLPTGYHLDSPRLIRIPYVSDHCITYYFIWNRANNSESFKRFQGFIEEKIRNLATN